VSISINLLSESFPKGVKIIAYFFLITTEARTEIRRIEIIIRSE
jgi:hypothetical protein